MTTYKEAGVDIENTDALVEDISRLKISSLLANNEFKINMNVINVIQKLIPNGILLDIESIELFLKKLISISIRFCKKEIIFY